VIDHAERGAPRAFDTRGGDSSLSVLAARPRDVATLGGMLLHRAETMPDAIAIGFLQDEAKETLTYAGLTERARRFTGLLRSHGCAPSDRVMLLVPPGFDYVAAFFGCLFAGAIPVPSYPPRGGRALHKTAHVITDSGARFVLLPGAMDQDTLRAVVPGDVLVLHVEDAVEAAPFECEPDPASPAFLQYTSGSTSQPKGVVLSHRAVLANLAQIESAFGHGPRSVGVNWLPPFHDMGLIGTILQPIYAGFPTYLMSPFSFVQRPSRWLKAIGRFGATTVGAPTFAFEQCVERIKDADLALIDLSSVRVLFCGAEPIRRDTLERFVARFAPCGLDPRSVYACYGLAESTLFVTGVEQGSGLVSRRAPDGARDFVSCGRPRAGTEIRVVDPERGVALTEGAIGEIWVRGESLATGYWGRRDATEASFRARLAGDPHGDDWLRTGDLGFLAEGELHPTGRLKDLIIVAGRKLAPEDIELSALCAVNAGADRAAVAYGVEAPDGTEAIALAIELADLAGESSGERYEAWGRAVRTALAEEQDVPLAELRLVRRGELLRTTSGKVERRASRDALEAGGITAAATWAVGKWS
jgi:acyl-CoA synthetase (AMP-forming)/AMP-acid ligase II